jgi:hypothetical protein
VHDVAPPELEIIPCQFSLNITLLRSSETIAHL